MTNYKLIIFDADGTLVEPASGETFRKTADDWQWLPSRLEKLRELRVQHNAWQSRPIRAASPSATCEKKTSCMS